MGESKKFKKNELEQSNQNSKELEFLPSRKDLQALLEKLKENSLTPSNNYKKDYSSNKNNDIEIVYLEDSSGLT